MEYGVHILPVYVDFTSRGKDPDLRLERPGRNRYEADQVHVLEGHESLTDFPLLIDGSVHGASLESGFKSRTTGDSAAMWTYSHGYKVPVELFGDLVHEFAASYRDTVLRPTQGGDLHLWLASNNTGRPVVITCAAWFGYPGNLGWYQLWYKVETMGRTIPKTCKKWP